MVLTCPGIFALLVAQLTPGVLAMITAGMLVQALA